MQRPGLSRPPSQPVPASTEGHVLRWLAFSASAERAYSAAATRRACSARARLTRAASASRVGQRR
eukprot:12583128-Alexandrium_andersonii.AAC.1